jgi:carbon-monoxide dehydrogenase medium subunit
MSSPDYHAPETIAQAVALLVGDTGAKPLSGGTDLIVQMRSGRTAPSALVDLKRIAGMSGIRELPGGGFAIGAATPCTSLKNHKGAVSLMRTRLHTMEMWLWKPAFRP